MTNLKKMIGLCLCNYCFCCALKVFYYFVFLGSLVDNKGKILVPGVYDHVAKLTDEEKKLYEKIEFDMEEYAKDVGAGKLLHDTKVHFITQNVISERIYFVLFVCMDYLGCYRHLVKMSSQQHLKKYIYWGKCWHVQ